MILYNAQIKSSLWKETENYSARRKQPQNVHVENDNNRNPTLQKIQHTSALKGKDAPLLEEKLVVDNNNLQDWNYLTRYIGIFLQIVALQH